MTPTPAEIQRDEELVQGAILALMKVSAAVCIAPFVAVAYLSHRTAMPGEGRVVHRRGRAVALFHRALRS